MRLTVTRKSDLAIGALRTLADGPDWMPGDVLTAAVGSTRATAHPGANGPCALPEPWLAA